jgi:hypothetical protein
METLSLIKQWRRIESLSQISILNRINCYGHIIPAVCVRFRNLAAILLIGFFALSHWNDEI